MNEACLEFKFYLSESLAGLWYGIKPINLPNLNVILWSREKPVGCNLGFLLELGENSHVNDPQRFFKQKC
jgi:hypothetical protein